MTTAAPTTLAPTTPAPLDPGDWANVLVLTIDHTKISSTLTNFPILINLGTSVGTNTYDATAVFDEVGANSHKIAITDSSYNQLYCEIEQWNDTSELASLHIKVPTISDSVDTILYLFYDNTNPDNDTYIGDTGDTAAQSVWDSNFVHVFHMAQDPNGDVADCILDSTSNGNDATPNGSMTSDDLIDFAPGKAIDLDGSNDYLSMTQYSGSSITCEMRLRTDNAYREAFWCQGANSNHTDFWLGSGSSNQAVFGLKVGGTQQVVGTTVLTNGNTYFLAGAYDTSSMKVFVNTTKESDSKSINPTAVGNNYIGAWSGYTSYSGFSDSVVSEARLSDIVRSDAWITATYYSLEDNLIEFATTLTTTAPTTIAVTTTAPTTLAPTTAYTVTTLGPTTTIVATTPLPTTLSPTTLPPTTLAPTTLAPTTLPPTTVAPTTTSPEYFETCFTEYIVGAVPSDWTEQWRTTEFDLDISATGTIGGKEFTFDRTYTGRRAAGTWDDVGSTNHAEILCKVRTETDDGHAIGPAFCVSGTVSTESGYMVWLDMVDDYAMIAKFSGGASTDDLDTKAMTLTPGNYYWVRFRISGDNLKAKVWAAGDPEPGTWDMDYTDPSPLSAGPLGLATWSNTGWCDWFSVATNGATARSPIDVAGCTTAVPTTTAPTTVGPTTLAPTAGPTTIVTTLAPTTLAPTTVAPTTSAPTSLAPTTIVTTSGPTTVAPTTITTTLAPTTVMTTVGPTTVIPTTIAPTTIVTTIAPTTIVTTLSPTTLAPTTIGPTTVAPTTVVPDYTCTQSLSSQIETTASLYSTITQEIDLNGDICR